MSEGKKEGKKILAIELKKPIQEILHEYMEQAGVSGEDMGFAMGFLNASMTKRDSDKQLMFMFQLYFFAGVHYAKTTKQFGYEMISPEEHKAKVTKLQEDMQKAMLKNKEKLSYMG
jgi:hypothetical protein